MAETESEIKQPLAEPSQQIANIDNNVDEETTQKKYPYPKSIGFIITNEFCERFSYYGMRAILVIYLRRKLNYSEDDATVIYHVFSMFVYFFPIFGAMIADSWLGRFKTIFFLSIVYACGNILLSLTSIPPLYMPERELTIVGLLLIAVGTGGIKPCVSAFGGDQFKLPEQAAQLATFFSLFYFAINCGSLISTFVTPILRNDVKCFDDDCYPLAFGIPGILMLVSIVVFVAGKPLYVMKKPAGNIIIQVSKTISHALKRRSKLKKEEKRDHWLDYADDKYPKSEINGIKSVLRVLVLFIPLPVFWALFDQQGSRWTFQATRMNGKMGDFILKADQVQVINPLLILAFIPLFEVAIYPALAWCKLVRKPLHKMVGGGLLASLSFIISAIVELELEKTYPVLPGAGIGHLRIYNSLNCPMQMTINGTNTLNISEFNHTFIDNYSVNGRQTLGYNIVGSGSCSEINHSGTLTVEEKEAWGVFLLGSQSNFNVSLFEDSSDKMSSGTPGIRILNNHDRTANISIHRRDTLETIISGTDTSLIELETATEYTFSINGQAFLTRNMEMGEVLVLQLATINNEVSHREVQVTERNSLHMMWLVPQYVIITMGEVMFSVTGLEFSFTQAPASMKSVLTAGWLLTIAFGNLIVVIVAEAQGFSSQAHEFFLFAGLMFVDIVIFWLMTLKYIYVDQEVTGDANDKIEIPEKLGLENMAYEDKNEEKN